MKDMMQKAACLVSQLFQIIVAGMIGLFYLPDLKQKQVSYSYIVVPKRHVPCLVPNIVRQVVTDDFIFKEVMKEVTFKDPYVAQIAAE